MRKKKKKQAHSPPHNGGRRSEKPCGVIMLFPFSLRLEVITSFSVSPLARASAHWTRTLVQENLKDLSVISTANGILRDFSWWDEKMYCLYGHAIFQGETFFFFINLFYLFFGWVVGNLVLNSAERKYQNVTFPLRLLFVYYLHRGYVGMKIQFIPKFPFLLSYKCMTRK